MGNIESSMSEATQSCFCDYSGRARGDEQQVGRVRACWH